MSKVTFLGLGAMGSRMAAKLIEDGHDVTVWNRTRSAADDLVRSGAKLALTPAEAVNQAEFVISMVRDDKASEFIWLDEEQGALNAMQEGAVAIEMSTLTPSFIKQLDKAVRENGVSLIDAPVAGSRPQAEAGALIIMAGAEAEVLNKAKHVLTVLGQTIHHVGPVGSGSVLKLVVNSLFGIQAAAMAELIKYMDQQTLDLPKALNILSSIPVTSPAATGLSAQMLAENFTPLFPIELVEKDFSYMLDSAESLKVSTPLIQSTKHIFAEAIRQGYGDDNISGVIQMQ